MLVSGRPRVRAGVARRRTALAVSMAAALMLSGCGSRLSETEVQAADRVTVTPGGSAGTSDGAAPGAGHGTGATVPGTAPTPGLSTGAPGVGNGVSAGSKPTKGQGQTGPAGSTNGTQQNATAGGSGACTTSGAPLRLGQVTTTSGLIGQGVGRAAPAIQAWVKWVNQTGGIACHPVSVTSVDDGSDNGRAAAAVSDLVKNQKVQALVANFIPLSAAGFRSGLKSNGVPAIGGEVAAVEWWQEPLMFPVGAATNSQAYGQTAALAKQGHTKVAVIYCVEAPYCPAFKDTVAAGQQQGGYSVVYDAQVSITAPDFTSQCLAAKNAGADQLSVIVDGASISRLARSCAGVGLKAPISAAALGATFDKQDPRVRAATVTIAAPAAFWGSSDTPGQKEFQAGMAKFAPNLMLDQATILAWADGMMLKAALEKLGAEARNQPITTAMILKALRMVKNEKLQGLVGPQNYGSSATQSNPPDPCYFPAQFGADGVWRALPAACLTGRLDG